MRRVQVSSRNSHKIYAKLKETLLGGHLPPPVPVDATRRETLTQAFENANAVVSLAGIQQGSPVQFEQIQSRSADNVARAAVAAGAKLMHVIVVLSGQSGTKALGEQTVLSRCPDAATIRSSFGIGLTMVPSM